MKAGIETGSLVNHLLAGAFDPATVSVGDPATILKWTDRTPGTVVKKTPTTIHVQQDSWTRVNPEPITDSQRYEYARDPQGIVYVFRKRKNGWRNTCGDGLVIGRRERYWDPCF